MTITLSSQSLPEIASAAIPSYDRSALKGGILHFGVGNFHRAHQAAYLDALFNAGRDLDWALIGAGVTDADRRMRATLAMQDYLTTLVMQSADRSVAQVTGPMTEFAPVGDSAALLARLDDPAVRIVSLTVTEGGYFLDPATGGLDAAHPAIVGDAARPAAPATVFGLIVAALRRRRAAGAQPFTVMSCDNLPHNGAVTRAVVAGLATLSDPALADWIRADVAFPNGMVDRITPSTGDEEREALRRDFGIVDRHPVFCETFSQWVLEDAFPAGRPALETVGVEFVSDVTPYEHRKIRLLNGGHALIAYGAGLLDLEYAHQAMAHPLIGGFLAKVAREEIVPLTEDLPGLSAEAYLGQVEDRFANPKIADTIRRLCFDGSNRQPKFVIPSMAERLRAGRSIDGLALCSALWCRYCAGVTEAGAEIAPNDPDWERLSTIARQARENPMIWLEASAAYGELAHAPALRTAFAGALTAIWADGVAPTLQRFLSV